MFAWAQHLRPREDLDRLLRAAEMLVGDAEVDEGPGLQVLTMKALGHRQGPLDDGDGGLGLRVL